LAGKKQQQRKNSKKEQPQKTAPEIQQQAATTASTGSQQELSPPPARPINGGARFPTGPLNPAPPKAVPPSRLRTRKSGINWVDAGILGLIILVIIAVAIFTAKPIAAGLQKHLGLDLQGGVHVVYQAVPTPEAPVTKDSMNSLRDNIEKRVNGLGVSEPVIQIENGNRILVELAGVKDPEEAVNQIGRTAHMEFKTEDGKVVLTGKDLSDAKAQLDTQTNEPEVSLTFNAAGAKTFAQVTSANVGKRIAIYLDDQLLTNPVVKTAIPDGNAVISGGYKTLQDAQSDALLLKAGALPVQVQLIEKRTVGPLLGQESLDRSLRAGLIGLVLVFIFMLFYYRVPGIVADLSLIVYALIMAGVYLLVHQTLTLPGIAAFIISVGMAVDANILIYERLKEELRLGKTLRSAFDAGFRHALRTILDCNVNTLIGATVLYYFGSGAIRGFAVTLFIGVFMSLFTAVTFTRFILHLLVSSRLVLNPKWYGLLKTKLDAALAKPAV